MNLAEFGLTELTNIEKDNALKSILNSANLLSSIVNDILDFSKIEAGKLDIENINFNLHEIINDAVQPLKKQASDKGIKFVLTVDENVAVTLKGDPTRISQILNNLCSNAIKFTKQGLVNLKVCVKKLNKYTRYFI